MKITEIFEEKKQQGKPVLSFEIFPPKKEEALKSIDATLEKLCDLNPDFISVTFGAGGSTVDNQTVEIAKKKIYTEDHGSYWREYAVNNIYADDMVSISNQFPPITLSEKNTARIAELNTELENYITSTYTRWIIDGGVEEEWDSYIAELKKMGVDEFISLLQEELDAFNAR